MSEKKDFPFKVGDIILRAKFVLGMKHDRELAAYLGVSPATISNWVSRNSIDLGLLLSRNLSIDYNWLITGKTLQEREAEGEVYAVKSEEVKLQYKGKLPERLEDQAVPLFDITAAANLHSLLSDGPQRLLGKIVIPQVPRCDGAVYVSGDSMYPLLKAGDIVGFKALSDARELIYGEMYLVSFTLGGEEYLVVKYINRSEQEGYIKLVSYNQFHQPMDIPMDAIRALALIKFSVRKNMIM